MLYAGYTLGIFGVKKLWSEIIMKTTPFSNNTEE